MTGARGRFLCLAIVAALSAATAAQAQVYYQYPGAPVVLDTSPALGATFAVGDEDVIRLLGYGRFNVSEVSDFGIELAIDHWDPDPGNGGWRLGGAADFRYAIVPSGRNMPFDLSVGGGLGVQTGNDVTNIDIPAGATISRPLELRNSRALTPYAALYLIYTHVSFDVPGRNIDDSDVDLELRLGASLDLGAGISGFVNAHVGHGELFAIGLNASL